MVRAEERYEQIIACGLPTAFREGNHVQDYLALQSWRLEDDLIESVISTTRDTNPFLEFFGPLFCFVRGQTLQSAQVGILAAALVKASGKNLSLDAFLRSGESHLNSSSVEVHAFYLPSLNRTCYALLPSRKFLNY